MNKILHQVRQSFVLLALLLITTIGFSQQATFQDGVRQGQVKVKFAPTMTNILQTTTVHAGERLSTGLSAFDAVVEQTTATNMKRLFPYNQKNEHKLIKHGLHLWYVIDVSEEADPAKVAAIYEALSEVEVAEVSRQKVLAPYTVEPYKNKASTNSTSPFNDPLLPDQWHYQNNRTGDFSGSDANVFEAWESTVGAADIIVSVHDQGADVAHEDLAANMWVNTVELNGVEGVDDDNNGYIDDVHGFNFDKGNGLIDAQSHGTHVAGTIAAVNNNGIGVAGVAGGDGTNAGAKIMSLQVMGGGSIENSFIYAADNGAVISQNSWGYTSPGYYDQSVLDAIDYFIAEAGNYPGSPMTGGIVVFAAGNSATDLEMYPGFYAPTLAVASTGPTGAKAYYSNFGSWVDVSAPGGDTNSGAENGVLSLAPGNSYAWMQGTSMACPHVSGIAALVLANRNGEMTAEDLRLKLETGISDVYANNPDYSGQMGTGSIDAAMAIANDQGIAPDAITDLTITGVAQEFASVSFTIPNDTDDSTPVSFKVYYATYPIDASNYKESDYSSMVNESAVGDLVNHDVNNLFGLTEYFFVVTALDRWGNESVLSNVVSATTNTGPALRIDDNSLSITMDYDVNTGVVSHPITIYNDADGLLRWNHMMRHKSTALSYNAAGIAYPVVNSLKSKFDANIKLFEVKESNPVRGEEEVAVAAFTKIEKRHANSIAYVIGENDTSFTNSAATRFFVDNAEGFNLTQVQMYTNHDPATGPMVVEVYKGDDLSKKNLVYAQEQLGWGHYATWSNVYLDEQLFFENGTTFWVVFHVPSGNLYPLGIGWENEGSGSDNSLMSIDMGATWDKLGTMMGDDNYAWSTVAVSENAYLGEYLTLMPANGEVTGLGNGTTTLSADGASLINGSYQSNVIITSNDASNQEVRLPVTLNVTGQTHNVTVPTVLDFGSTFEGTESTVEFVVANNGLGNYNALATWSGGWTISDPQFTLAPWPLGAPSQIKAKEEYTMGIIFKPTTIGPVNATLTITDGVTDYTIALYGVGTETSEMTISPQAQTISGLTIGDGVNASVTVENTGGYPLEYFIPGYDEKGISDNWPTEYHSYGYNIVSSDVSEADPIAYDFIDISATGVEITDIVKNRHDWATVDMGFNFPYYNDVFDTLYVGWAGFTAFSDSVRAGNEPSPRNNPTTPRGYISPWGNFIDYSQGTQVHYEVMPDRLIVQWTNAWDQIATYSTVQMVLFPNGNIRFYYPNINIDLNYSSIMINSYDRDDPVVVSGFYKNRNLPYDLAWKTQFALGFDYPGPDIITNVSNGSGILMPGEMATIDVTMVTDDLVEGTTNRYLNIIGNDPANFQQSALMALDITAGGMPTPIVSTDTVAFGNVFQNAIASVPFTIKNSGTANVEVTSMTWVNNSFSMTGSSPNSIASGLYDQYSIEMPTATLAASLEDWLAIDYADGAQDTIYVTGAVVDAPGINVDLSLLQETLAHGDTLMSELTIENTGLADLEAVVVGKQWMTFDEAVAPSGMQESHDSYAYETYSDGSNYQWVDIRETGTKLPALEWDDAWFTKESYWRTIDLPFPVEFYGETFDYIRIAENGVLTFEDMSTLVDGGMVLPREWMPTDETYEGGFIFPYWSFATIGAPHIPENEQGIFYQFYDEKIIISWEYLVNWFGGMGDPISAQVILYNNGTMKFQYKVNGTIGDLTSASSSIGLQNRDHSDYTAISQNAAVSHGQGLAYIIKPAEKHVITPGSVVTGEIKLDARNIYGGVYNDMLSIQTNVPGSENLDKPVELTVTGDAIYSLQDIDSVDFGTMIVKLDEWGNPQAQGMPIQIANTGAAALDITWMARKTELVWPEIAQSTLQVYVECPPNDPWCWGGWTDIENIFSPWAWPAPEGYSILPNESMEFNVAFKANAPGMVRDTFLITTNVGEKMFIIKANAILPPVLNIDDSGVEEVMNEMTETTNHSIAFDNLAGASDLSYEIGVEYSRITPTSVNTNEAVAGSGGSPKLNGSGTSGIVGGITTNGTYNRTLQHGTETVPTTHLGTGGQSSFSAATLYNTGDSGFNLSHVESWFRVEGELDATITLEVRAGGTNISDAATIATGSITLEEASQDDEGSWRIFELDEVVLLYPNEDFYVIITYPFGIQFPQGTVEDFETAPGRYFYKDQGNWFDLQESSFSNAQWLMFAAEETPVSTEWITLTSPTNGVLSAGEASAIDFMIEGAIAQRGDQIAHIVFNSDDLKKPVSRIPVSLHMNDAPVFSNAELNYMVAEGETLMIELDVMDMEGNAFTVDPMSAYEGVTSLLNENEFTIEYIPDFGEEGTHEFAFVATDAYNASREITIVVEVAHSNQAPVFTDPTIIFEYGRIQTYTEHDFAEFFTDPDGDNMTYSVVSSDEEIAEVYGSDDKFVVRTMAMGEASLILTATDVYGATTIEEVAVNVSALVLGTSDDLTNAKLKVYPNPTVSTVNVSIHEEWSGLVQVQVLDLAGRVYQEEEFNVGMNDGLLEVDMSKLNPGLYLLKVSNGSDSDHITIIKQ